MPAPALKDQEQEVPWKKRAKAIFSLTFMLAWILFVASFYFDGKAMHDGTTQPTATHTEPVQDHGRTVYIRPAESRLNSSRDLLFARTKKMYQWPTPAKTGL